MWKKNNYHGSVENLCSLSEIAAVASFSLSFFLLNLQVLIRLLGRFQLEGNTKKWCLKKKDKSANQEYGEKAAQ